MKAYFGKLALVLGTGILSFIFFNVLITSIVFLCAGKVLPVWAIISLLLSLGLTYYLSRKVSPIKWVPLVQVGILFSIIAGSVVFSSLTVDSSFDGNWYHKTSIGEMKNGWNPVYTDSRSFNASEANPLRITGLSADQDSNGKDGTPWLMADHYPKASWVFGANIYSVTNNIESAKLLAPLLIFAVFLFAFGYLYRKVDVYKASLIAFLVAANPIIVIQLFNFYNDGILGNLIIILVISLTILIDANIKMPHKALIAYSAIFMAIVLVINLKFTGIIYAGITVFCYLAYISYRRDWKVARRLVVVSAAALIVGLAVVGASTYVKNTLTAGNPLYPLIGSTIQIIEGNQPVSYDTKNGVRKFIEANLSPVANISRLESIATGNDTKPKVPLTVSASEVNLLSLPDSRDYRQGGYGVWSSGILIVSVIVGIYLLVRYAKKYRSVLPLFLLPIVTILIPIIALDTSWWARYLPQLYIFPVIVVLALFLVRSRFMSSFLIFALLFNLFVTFTLGFSGQVAFAKASHAAIQAIPCSNNEPVVLTSSRNMEGAVYNIQDRCKNVTTIHPTKVDKAVIENSKEVYMGILLIHQN